MVNQMKKFFLFCALAALGLFCAVASAAQTPQTSTTQGDSPRPARARVVGEVTALDAAAGRVTVRTDAGEAVTLSTHHKKTDLRPPPPGTTPEKAAPATLADVRAGAPGRPPRAAPSPAHH